MQVASAAARGDAVGEVGQCHRSKEELPQEQATAAGAGALRPEGAAAAGGSELAPKRRRGRPRKVAVAE